MANYQKFLEEPKDLADNILNLGEKASKDNLRVVSLGSIESSLFGNKEAFVKNHNIVLTWDNKSDDYFTNGFFKRITAVIEETEELLNRVREGAGERDETTGDLVD